jgi:hypothetical protein
MKTFTVIAECLGGTYISQYAATSAEDAIAQWARAMPDELTQTIVDKRPDLGGISFEELGTPSQEEITPIEGIESVWFAFMYVEDVDIFLNIVDTVIGPLE